MKFFIDTAEVSEIRELVPTGLVDGVTTNPSLIAKSGRNIREVLEEICALVDGPVSGEVTATDAKGMVEEGQRLAEIAPNLCVKLPLTMEGITACNQLSEKGIQTNVTLCFTAGQALLAAKAGATFVSPFVGRLDDIAFDGLDLISEICTVFAQYDALKTEVLVASVRSPLHVVEAAKMGADVATLPPKTLHQLVKHPLTDRGLEAFLKDWASTGQSIL